MAATPFSFRILNIWFKKPIQIINYMYKRNKNINTDLEELNSKTRKRKLSHKDLSEPIHSCHELSGPFSLTFHKLPRVSPEKPVQVINPLY